MTLLAKYTFFSLLMTLGVTCNATIEDVHLKSMIRTTYSEDLLSGNIHGLMKYILVGTDYKIYFGRNAPDDAVQILRLEPRFQRTGVLMSRIDALLMAVGMRYSIVVDEKNKLISVTRNPINEI